MINQNTTPSEDDAIRRAKNGDAVSDLLDIIDRLDAEIESWKEATVSDSPAEYKERQKHER